MGALVAGAEGQRRQRAVAVEGPSLWRKTVVMPSLNPATPEFIDDAPYRVTAEVTVPVTAGACWAALAEAATWVEWFPGITETSSNPPVWTAPGDTRTVTVNRLTVDERAIVVDPGQEYAFTILRWSLPIGKRAVEAVRLAEEGTSDAPRTRLTYIAGMDLNPFGRLIWPVLKKQLAKAWTTGFEQLGQYVSK